MPVRAANHLSPPAWPWVLGPRSILQRSRRGQPRTAPWRNDRGRRRAACSTDQPARFRSSSSFTGRKAGTANPTPPRGTYPNGFVSRREGLVRSSAITMATSHPMSVQPRTRLTSATLRRSTPGRNMPQRRQEVERQRDQEDPQPREPEQVANRVADQVADEHRCRFIIVGEVEAER